MSDAEGANNAPALTPPQATPPQAAPAPPASDTSCASPAAKTARLGPAPLLGEERQALAKLEALKEIR